MADQSVVALLAAHRSLGGAPAAEHEWLAAHGVRHSIRTGEVVTHKGELATALHIVFSGRIAIHVDRGAGSHKIIEWGPGDVGGALPYSRGARAPNDSVAEEPTEVLAVPIGSMAEMTRECPMVTATLVHAMVDRARQFNASDLHDEKLVSLGRLAAGLAHELNNPASAAVRSAKLLSEGLLAAESAAAAVGSARLSDTQLAAVARVRQLCEAPPVPARRSSVRVSSVGLSSIARADREDAIVEWLSAHGASEASAVALAETQIPLDALDTLAASVNGPALDVSLQWIAAGCLVRTLASEIETATSRIHDLIASVKGFTFMDRAPTPEPVDISRGIGDTLTMLAGKTRAKGVEIIMDLADDLPRAHAVGAELNQVWMNLIDNALDAVPAGGHVTVTASGERDRVVVRVTDDGAGIPAEITGRIFDPFFTTKEVGKGTGLGLDIVRRILRRHDGEIEVESRPGYTQFRVLLPRER